MNNFFENDIKYKILNYSTKDILEPTTNILPFLNKPYPLADTMDELVKDRLIG